MQQQAIFVPCNRRNREHNNAHTNGGEASAEAASLHSSRRIPQKGCLGSIACVYLTAQAAFSVCCMTATDDNTHSHVVCIRCLHALGAASLISQANLKQSQMHHPNAAGHDGLSAIGFEDNQTLLAPNTNACVAPSAAGTAICMRCTATCLRCTAICMRCAQRTSALLPA